ncbi:hypothetical protein ABE82_26125 (plasmid) [Paenibacillus peoriae]|uniref:hypothetical protein n=1 Tax=Paenibacillus peoriae TaxID=59893 RepID=UPI000720A8DC|nr:hypothetical protein [Paenibacillus peoriae]ALS09899.1 hypothetical protein ABE82_26125 [Paenibacillus peoriae]
MDVQKVIQLGQLEKHRSLFYSFSTTTWVYTTLIVLLLLALMVFWFYRTRTLFPIVYLFLIIIAAGLIINLEVHKKEAADKQIAIEKWKNNIVRPYIESLPKTHKEIIYIKITPEINSSRNSDYSGESWYTSKSTMERTPLTVAYKDNGIVTSTDFYEIHAELSDHEKPYIEFLRLAHDLGNNVDSGKYNMKIYIPKSIKLNQDGIWLTSSNLIFS